METDSTISLFYIYRYNSTTGTFTVPPGGDGLYYFSAYFVVESSKLALITIKINRAMVCTAYTDQEEIFNDGHSACSGVAYATEGLYPYTLHTSSYKLSLSFTQNVH